MFISLHERKQLTVKDVLQLNTVKTTGIDRPFSFKLIIESNGKKTVLTDTSNQETIEKYFDCIVEYIRPIWLTTKYSDGVYPSIEILVRKVTKFSH